MSNEAKIVVGYRFDRDAVWAKVKDRKAVYLDMMIWIAMGDDKPEGRTIKSKLRDAVRAGKVFCPLSQSSLWELHKQDYSKLRTGALMEEFSLNVCFSRKQDVFSWEVEQFAKRSACEVDTPSARKMLFTSIIGHVAGDMTLAFDAGTSEDVIQAQTRLICGHLDAMGLTEFLKLAEHDKGIASHFKSMAPPPYQKQAQFFHQHARADRGKVWRAEELAVADAYIKPAMANLSDELHGALARFFDGVQVDKHKSKLHALIAECPALHNHLEAMTRNSEDHNRKDRVNDFFDLEMLAVPFAYANAFATWDKWVRERFLKPGGFLKRSKCQFCSSIAELESWLDTA
jgi:hypothetical protein